MLLWTWPWESKSQSPFIKMAMALHDLPNHGSPFCLHFLIPLLLHQPCWFPCFFSSNELSTLPTQHMFPVPAELSTAIHNHLYKITFSFSPPYPFFALFFFMAHVCTWHTAHVLIWLLSAVPAQPEYKLCEGRGSAPMKEWMIEWMNEWRTYSESFFIHSMNIYWQLTVDGEGSVMKTQGRLHIQNLLNGSVHLYLYVCIYIYVIIYIIRQYNFLIYMYI